MLVSDLKLPLNVESLTEIMASQLALFGDQQLIIRPKAISSTGLEVVVNHEVLIWCMSDEEMAEDNSTLSAILKRLESYRPETPIAFTSTARKKPFQIGFKTDEGFVEVLNSKEIQPA